MIHAVGMLLNFWEVQKYTCFQLVYFPAFPKVLQHLSYMDHAILHGKPFVIPLLLHGHTVTQCYIKLDGVT